MEEQNTVLEEETPSPEVSDEEYVDETEYEDESDDQEEPEQEDGPEQEDDAEIEYDDDGNVVESVAEESEDAPAHEAVQDAPTDSTETVGKGVERVDEDAPRLRAELDALRKQTSETLKKLGVETDDPMGGLEALAADAEGLTLEEYRQRKFDAERAEKADRLLKQQEFERLAAQDLAALQTEFPETRAYKSLLEMPAEVRQVFARLREKGLSPKQAYAAANVDGIRSNVAASVKKTAMHDGKEHLRTAVPKNAKNTAFRMTRSQLEEARAIFPGYSDQKIIALYKQASKN